MLMMIETNINGIVIPKKNINGIVRDDWSLNSVRACVDNNF